MVPGRSSEEAHGGMRLIMGLSLYGMSWDACRATILMYLYLDLIVCSLENVREGMAKIDRKVDLKSMVHPEGSTGSCCIVPRNRKIECVIRFHGLIRGTISAKSKQTAIRGHFPLRSLALEWHVTRRGDSECPLLKNVYRPSPLTDLRRVGEAPG